MERAKMESIEVKISTNADERIIHVAKDQWKFFNQMLDICDVENEKKGKGKNESKIPK